jgi:methylglutaconyl-CoA hydratase
MMSSGPRVAGGHQLAQIALPRGNTPGRQPSRQALQSLRAGAGNIQRVADQASCSVPDAANWVVFMYMASGVVDVRVTGAVGTIVLNRAERRNALSRTMVAELGQAFDDLHVEKRVRAVVLTGAGTAFCSGLDVHEMKSLDGLPDQEREQQWGDAADAYRELVAQMIEFPKPIIASVNGPAVAGGAGLVLACDIVVAGEAAQFGLPDPRRGVVAGVVGPLLAFRVGAGPAARLLLTSSLYPAAEAFRLGIYHEMIDDDRLWARAVAIGEECAAGAPEAVQLTKRLLYETVGEQLATQLSVGAAISATSHTTEAAREGFAAFVEKRSPEWK